MARPLKKGLDYFPMDTTLDLKMQLVKAKYHLEGIGFIDLLYRIIYNEGYYIKLDEDKLLMLSMEFGLEEKRFEEILNFCVEKDFFDKNLWENEKVLTSNGIQKRYFHKTAKRTEQKYEFLLPETLINSAETLINSAETEVNSQKASESKVKESKVNKNKIKEEETTLSDALSIWNTFAEKNNLSKIIKLSEKRKSGIRQRLKEKEFDLFKILESAQQSKFLLGDNDRGWKISFDFIFCRSDKYLEILEGKYNGQNKQDSGASLFHLAELAAARFKRQQG